MVSRGLLLYKFGIITLTEEHTEIKNRHDLKHVSPEI